MILKSITETFIFLLFFAGIVKSSAFRKRSKLPILLKAKMTKWGLGKKIAYFQMTLFMDVPLVWLHIVAQLLLWFAKTSRLKINILKTEKGPWAKVSWGVKTQANSKYYEYHRKDLNFYHLVPQITAEPSKRLFYKTNH